MTYRTTMEASRGNILDRNGNVPHFEPREL